MLSDSGYRISRRGEKAMWIRLFNASALITALAGCAAQPPSKVPVKNITPLQAVEKDSVGDECAGADPS
jgi:hypothetical protein